MEPFRYHVYICKQQKPEGAPSCAARGAERIIEALKKELAAAGLSDEVQVTGCDCLGLCDKGPNLVVYPEGVWYSAIKPGDMPLIVKEHLKSGKPVERLVRTDAQTMRQEILDHNRKVSALKEMMEKAGVPPEMLNNHMRGFQESRAILTAIELDMFSAVGQGATAREVAEKIKAHPRATETMLNVLTSLEMLIKDKDIFRNTPLTARFLTAGSPDNARPALMHLVHLWPRWSTLTEAVRKGTAVEASQIVNRPEESNRAFIAAMHRNASFRAPQVAGLLDLTGVKRLLDLGAGSGAYAMAFAGKKPEMEVTVFDLPPVIKLTEEYIAQAGLAGKIKTMTGNMVADPIGEGYDMVFLSAICHMFSPEENLDMLGKILASLGSRGRIVIQDFILDETKTKPRSAALFALNMLVNTRGGGTYSDQEYVSWLIQTGFAEAKKVPLPGPTDLIIGTKA